MWLYPKTKSVGGGFLMSQSYTHAYHSLSPHAFWPQAKFRLLVALGKEDERERERRKKKKKRQQNPCNLFCCYSDTTPLFSALKKKKKKKTKLHAFFFFPPPPPAFFRHARKQLSKCTESCTNYGWNFVGTTIKMLSTCFKQANNMLTYITL